MSADDGRRLGDEHTSGHAPTRMNKQQSSLSTSPNVAARRRPATMAWRGSGHRSCRMGTCADHL